MEVDYYRQSLTGDDPYGHPEKLLLRFKRINTHHVVSVPVDPAEDCVIARHYYMPKLNPLILLRGKDIEVAGHKLPRDLSKSIFAGLTKHFIDLRRLIKEDVRGRDRKNDGYPRDPVARCFKEEWVKKTMYEMGMDRCQYEPKLLPRLNIPVGTIGHLDYGLPDPEPWNVFVKWEPPTMGAYKVMMQQFLESGNLRGVRRVAADAQLLGDIQTGLEELTRVSMGLNR